MNTKSYFQNKLKKCLTGFLLLFIFCVANSFAQVYFSDDFENGLSNWLVSAQGWDTTSASYSSPNHSATDSPDGNYPTYANSEMILANNVDLSSSEVPVLTFWHKYYTQGNADYCRVEISEDGGFNWTEIIKFSGGNRTWSFIQLDLSAYKTSPIKVKFRLTSDNYNQYDGWNIDDVEIKEENTLKTPFPFSDNFESGLSNWLVSVQGWDTTSTSYSSSTHSVTDSPDGNYPTYANSEMILANNIDLSSSVFPVLTFWHKYYTQGNADYCRVEISEDGGFNWTEIIKFSGGNRTWSFIQLDLSAYKTSPIKVKFRLTSDNYNQYDGWNIDDVEIYDSNDSNRPPYINSLTAVPISGKPPLTVTLNCQASDNDGNITEYRWDFEGDGVFDDTTETGQHTYIYENIGNYNATCRAVDNEGTLSPPKSVTITVYPSDPSRTVEIPDTSASKGDTIQIPIRITNATSIAGAELKVTYDANILEAKSVSNTTLTNGFTVEDSVMTGNIAVVMAASAGLPAGPVILL